MRATDEAFRSFTNISDRNYGCSAFSANSIQLEDQQGRLEQEIRELLMKEGKSFL